MSYRRKIIENAVKFLCEAVVGRGFALDSPAGLCDGCKIVLKPGNYKFNIRCRSSIHAALNARDIDEPMNDKEAILLVVPYLTATAMDHCRQRGLCVIDVEGNMLISVPGLYLERYKQVKRPAKPGTSGSVFTARASRIVRALLVKHPESLKQSELAQLTGISAGYVSTRIRIMESEGYIVRDGEKIVLLDPDRLLTDWSRHYRFDRHLRNRYAISLVSYEQGLDKVHKELTRLGVKHAFTGWSGAFLVAPYGEAENIMAYVDEIPDNTDLQYLSPVDRGGDVILLEPHDAGVFDFCDTVGTSGLPVVSSAQLYIDLAGMAGRAPEQAEELRRKLLQYERKQDADQKCSRAKAQRTQS